MARLGNIARASEQLHLTPQSIRGQLGELEDSLGVQLFRRVGRGLKSTDTGREIFSYADNNFTIGNDPLEAVQAHQGKKMFPFRVGIAASVPKLLAYRVVELVCAARLPRRAAAKPAGRVGSASTRTGDCRQPMPSKLNVRRFSYLIGESDLTVFATSALSKLL